MYNIAVAPSAKFIIVVISIVACIFLVQQFPSLLNVEFVPATQNKTMNEKYQYRV